MRDLLRVELTRLRWRRAVLLLCTAAIVIPGLILITTAWTTRPMSDAEVDALLSQRYAKREVTQCTRDPQSYFGDPVPDSEAADACRAQVAQWYGGRRELRLSEELQGGALIGSSTVVLLLLVLLGTTFVGHDWNTGSMSNQLLFEPRRARVWLAKGLAVLAVALALSLLVLGVVWSLLWWITSSRDTAGGGSVVTDGYQQVLRTAALAAGAALGGYVLTMLFRSTVATLGVLFGVVVASGALLAMLGWDSGERWQPQLNVAAVVTNQVTYYDESAIDPTCFGNGRVSPGVDCDGEKVLDAVDGALYLGTLLVLVGAGSLVSFRRRDVP